MYQNEGKSYIGSVVIGKGFILEEQEAKNIIVNDKIYSEIIFPYLSGHDLNSSTGQEAKRKIINFKDLTKDYCQEKYPICFDIVKRLVKPHRDSLKRKGYRELWWQYAEKCTTLYNAINQLKRTLVVARVSKYVAPVFVSTTQVFMDKIIVFPFESAYYFSIIGSSIYEYWAWKNSSTLGSSTINHSPSECFNTFPFPQSVNNSTINAIEAIGEKYHETRNHLMLKMQLGLTKIYNLFHNKQLSVINNDLPEKEIEKQYGKETISLWNHLNQAENTCSFNEAVQGIFELRCQHKAMDETVFKTYGWEDIDLAHDFYEVDYLPENDRVRYTISPDARKEVLKRLLKLNHEIHEQEQKETPPQKNKLKKKQQPGAPKQLDIF